MKRTPFREKLRRELASARLQTDRLFEMVSPRAMYDRPIPERHRIIFYLGHLEAFDWNMIAAASFAKPSLDPAFDRLFAFGIDPVGGGLPDDQPSDWPRLDEILSYNRRVRAAVDALLDGVDFEDPVQPHVRNGQIFRVAIEHRLMHAETLAYMLHWLDYRWKRLPNRGVSPAFDQPQTSSASRRQRDIPPGYAQLGQESGAFGWDNEFQASAAFVPEFSIDVFNVTNNEFLQFIRAGGYHDRSFWTDDGWDWIRQSGIEHPKFWTRRENRWFYRTMFEEIPLPPPWPVYVSHAEAAAYARWKGKSLPTETQFHRAAFGSQDAVKDAQIRGNFDSRYWTPEPVGAHPEHASPFGIYDLVGNGWEWTSTPFAPFAGFEPFPFYPGYSADFFDGKHFVMKGASPRTPAQLVRKSFRNWFQPHYANVYATFRCVQ